MNDTPIAAVTPKPRKKRVVKKPVLVAVTADKPVVEEHSLMAQLALNYISSMPIAVLHEYIAFFETAVEDDQQFDIDIKAICAPIATSIMESSPVTDEELCQLALVIAVVQGSRKQQ